MRPLPVSIEHHAGEPAISFASRLAAAMAVPSVRDFCRHMRVGYYALIRGEAEPLERLAILGRTDPAELRKHSPILLDGYSEINGQKLPKRYSRGSNLVGCPECLADDLRLGSGPMAARPYLRSSWFITLTRGCPVHRLPLVKLGAGLASYVERDVAVIVRESPDLHAARFGDREPLPASDFADYVHGRLLGHDGPSLLDGLPFYVAVTFTEMLGASMTIGPRFEPRELSAEDWWMAGKEGFSVTRHGVEGLHAFLSSRLTAFWDSDRVTGAGTILGTLGTWLSTLPSNPDFASVRRIIREHAADNLPLGPGDNFLGPIESRRWHSVHSAAREYAVHPKRLRKQLARKGFIRPGHELLTDDRTLFAAGPAAPFLAELASSMSAEEASDYGGFPRSVWELLVTHGHIRPAAPGSAGSGSYAVYSREEIDACLARLTRTARPMRRGSLRRLTKGVMLPIQAAAKRAKCSIVDIVRFIEDGKLETVGTETGVQGFRGILVDVAEVRRHVPRPNLEGVSLRDVERRLRTTTFTVKALIDGGHLKAERKVNPVNRCPQTVVMPEVLAAFDENYVSLARLALDRRTQIAVLKRELDKAGIEPAFDLGEKAARFYLRRSVPSLITAGIGAPMHS